MPSPIGHALAGCAVVWAADLVDRQRSSPQLAAVCAVLATTPDLDLFAPQFHRSATHSVTAVFFVLIIAAAVTGKVSRLRASRYGGQDRSRAARSSGQSQWRAASLCAAAYASHLLLDWLGADEFPPAGIQVLWPFSHSYFVSGWHIFHQTERKHLFSAATMDQNLRAVAKEVVVLVPIAAALWLVRIKTASGLPSQVARGHHPPQ